MNSKNDSTTPLVSCIMPTYNRRTFVAHAIEYFLRQDYRSLELIIVDDGTDSVADLVPEDNPSVFYHRLETKITLGAKLNLACSYARGEIIVHWDDDDWYAARRISYQVKALETLDIDVCGINKLFYLDFNRKKGFIYQYPANQRKWLLGSSLCYRKTFWQTHKFADINVGMDGLFVWSTTPDRVHVLDDATIAVHMIHCENVSPKKTEGAWWNPYPVNEIQDIMGDKDWMRYLILADYHSNTVVASLTEKGKKRNAFNIFACLVHEKEDCIIDMVLNLYHLDPQSIILIYNGGHQQNLFTSDFSYENYGVVFHPDSAPVKWGYLHDFALRCMAFAHEHFTFETMTIVDSDQLSIRSGYSEFLRAYLSGRQNVGLLSSAPQKVLANNASNPVGIHALKEKNIWQPFLKTFEGGDDQFVYWTFWPGTVFTSAAARDLVTIFRENTLLQDIMRHTKIWATEEVILPTLVKLLGYDILQNPCCYDSIKYKKIFQRAQIENAFEIHNAYWVHPVNRSFDDPIRSLIRHKFNNYETHPQVYDSRSDFKPTSKSHSDLLSEIQKIEGWLSDREASLLIHSTLSMLQLFPDFPNVVEIGSYHGKSTVLFGKILNTLSPTSALYAIDTHDGLLGDEDIGLATFPPSYDHFINNISHAGLTDFTHIIKGKSCEVHWNKPISLLFIDGLHDYRNVAMDFCHFEEWIELGGFVVFHDYADYFPGVKKFVREILDTGQYLKVDQSESLIVLQKEKIVSVAQAQVSVNGDRKQLTLPIQKCPKPFQLSA